MRLSLRNISIARRQWLLVGAVMLLTSLQTLATLWQFESARSEVKEVVTNWLPSVAVAGRIRRDVDEFRRYQLQLLIAQTPEIYHTFMLGLDSVGTRVEKSSDDYKALETELDGPLYREFLAYWRQYLELHKLYAVIADSPDKTAAIGLINGEARKLFQNIKKTLDALVEVNQSGAQRSAERINGIQTNARIMGGILLACSIALTVGLTWTIAQSITKPAQALVNAAKEAADGKYDTPIGSFGDNELGRLADAFRVMNHSLANNAAQQANINALGAVLTGDKTNAELARDVLRFVAERLDVQASALYTTHLERTTLVMAGAYAMNLKAEERRREIQLGEGLVGQAAADRRLIAVADIPPDAIQQHSRLAGDFVPRHVFAVPFVYQDNLVGVMELWKLRPFSAEQHHFLQTMMESVAVALYTARKKDEVLQQNLSLAAANEEIQRQIEVQAEQSHAIELANTKLHENLMELSAAKEEIERQVEVQNEQQRQLELAYIEMEEKNLQLSAAKEEIERQMEEQATQQQALEKTMVEIQEANWELLEAKEELQRQAEIQDAQAVEIELANAALQEKNIEIERTLKKLQEVQQHIVQSEKMAGLGQITAGIAHEINNPVTFISGAVKPLQRDLNDILDVLAEYSKLRPDADAASVKLVLSRAIQLKHDIELDDVIAEMKDLLKSMDNGAARIAEIVKGLRNFSRLDEQDLKMVDVHEGIDSTLTILRSQYKDHIEIIKEYGVLPLVECHAGQINQVFMNILSNAIQAIEGTGSIRIKTSSKASSEGEAVIISIKDSGKGMTAEVRNRIFEPFFTTKDVGKGTGLGLSISFGVIEKHNGTLEVQSELGRGAEFIITLPVSQPSDGAKTAA
jgi:signal transduction histidine kinase/HAMP domain-containing protein